MLFGPLDLHYDGGLGEVGKEAAEEREIFRDGEGAMVVDGDHAQFLVGGEGFEAGEDGAVVFQLRQDE